MARKKTKKISEVLSSLKELTSGVTVEESSPVYYDLTRLKRQPEVLYRLDNNGIRYYYRLVNGEPEFFVSVTTMIKNTLPTPRALIKWMTENEDSESETMERAGYGTFLHMCCQSLAINGFYDLDKLGVDLKKFMERERLQGKSEWESELKKDVLAFGQFIIDHKVIPLAVEVVLYHPNDGYAGALDLVCMMTIEEKGYFGEVYASGVNKGQPKESKRDREVVAIVDIKSGRKGFYESHEIQLSAYKEMWNIHFSDLPVEKTLNFSPKDWRTKPSYNLKDQTDAKSALKLPYLTELAKIEDTRKDKSITILQGKIELVKGLEQNIKETTLTELIKGNHEEK